MAEVNRIIADLKAAKGDDARIKAAKRLREWVRFASRGGTDANFGATMTILLTRLSDLVNAEGLADRMAGVTAIYELTDEPVPDNETKIARFAQYLRVLPTKAVDAGLLRLVSKALGHLARAGGAMTADFVDYEVKRALQTLEDPGSPEGPRFASVLILRELAEAAPALFYPHMAPFFGCIWVGLSDPRLWVRERAARALTSALALVSSRKSRAKDQWFGFLYAPVISALSFVPTSGRNAAPGPSAEVIHGALLAIGELLNKSITESFLLPRFHDVCNAVLRHREHKDRTIRHTVLVLLPRLAHYFPETFVRGGFSDSALLHLLGCLRDPKQSNERGTLFVAVGRIALAVGSHLSADALRPQLERIVAVVREGLTPAVTGGSITTRTVKRPFVPEALTCVAMLAGAVGPALLEFTHELLDPMFAEGLSPMLTEALQAVSAAIPALKPLLQERLLHELALVLANRPFVPPVADPAPLLGRGAPGAAGLAAAQLMALAGSGAETVGLALAEGAPVGDLFGHPGAGVGAAAAALGAGYYSSYSLMPPGVAGWDAAQAAGAGAYLSALQQQQAGADAASAALFAAGANGAANAPWTAFGALPQSTQAALSSRVATGTGVAGAAAASGGSTLSALAALLSAANPFSSGAGGGGAGGSGGGGRDHREHGGAGGGAGVHPGQGYGMQGAPVGIGSPGPMSWARNLPSSALSGGAGDGSAGGSGGGSAGFPHAATYGLGGYGAAIGEGPSMLVLASARGVPVEVVRQALHTLGTFDFSGVPLLPFVREVVMLYLDDDDGGVRLEAALTCSRLLVRPTDLTGRGQDPLLGSVYYGGLQEMSAAEEALELALDGSASAAAVPAASARGAGGAGGASGSGASSVGGSRDDEAIAAYAALSIADAGDADGTGAGSGGASGPGDDVAPGTLSEGQRERWAARLQLQLVRRLRLPQHPLLVLGTDMVTLGAGIGDYTSPVALALAGYAGGLADVGRANADMLGGPGPGGWTASSLERLQEQVDGAGRAGAGSSLSSILGAVAGVVGSGPTLMVVSQLLQRLIMMAITDPEPAIRFEILAALDGRFDALLVEEENLRLLMQGLQDENHVCREAVLAVLGRLAAHNPAPILQALRATLIAVLGELEYADAHPDVGLLPYAAAGSGGGRGGYGGGGLLGDGLAGASAVARRGSASGAAAAGFRSGGGGGGGAGSAGGGGAGGDGQGASGAGGAGGDGSGSGAAAGADVLAASALGLAVPGSGLNSTTPASLRIGAFYASAGAAPTLAAGAGGGGREHAARMLGLLIRATQRLVVPYVPVILRALLPQVWATSPARPLLMGDMGATVPLSAGQLAGAAHPDVLSSCVLAAVGELSAVGADAMLPYLHVLLPLVVDAFLRGAYALGIGHQFLGGGAAALGPHKGAAAAAGIAGGLADAGGGLGGFGGGGAGGGGGGGRDTHLGGDGLSDIEGFAGGGFGAAAGAGDLSGADGVLPPSGLHASAASYAATAYVIADPARFTEVAVRSLGLLVENTGHVIVPYLDHPHLLQVLIAIISRGPGFNAGAGSAAPAAAVTSGRRGAGSGGAAAAGFAGGSGGGGALHWSLRREAMRTFGILGALDPYRHRMAQIAQAQRGAAAVQAAIRARLAAAMASAEARGRRLAGAGLSSLALQRGVRPAGSHMTALLAAEDAVAGNPMSAFALPRPDQLLSARETASRRAGGAAGAGGAAAQQTAIIIPPDGASTSGGAWDLAAYIPSVVGVALGGGIETDPMEAAMAGLAGESGANVGINLDEVGLGLAGLGGGTVGGLGFGMDDVYNNNNLNVLGGAFGVDALAAAAAAGRAGPAAGDGTGAGGSPAGGGAGGADGAGAGGPLAVVANLPASAILPSMISPSEDFFPTVALTALLNILGDDALSLHHNTVLQSVMKILRSLGQHCVVFLPRVLPTFLAVLKSTVSKGTPAAAGLGSGLRGAGGSTPALAGAGGAVGGGRGGGAVGGADDGTVGAAGLAAAVDTQAALRETVLQQLAALALLVKHHLRPWLPPIFSLLRLVWPASLPQLLRVVEAVAAALGEEAKPYIASLVPHMLSVLAHDATRPVAAPVPAVEALLRESGGYAAAFAAGGADGLPAGGAGGGVLATRGGVGGGSLAAAGGIAAPQLSPARANTRHVLHTIIVLVCGGRRALWGGHRHLLDEHMPLLVPAIARLIDAGIGAVARQAAGFAAEEAEGGSGGGGGGGGASGFGLFGSGIGISGGAGGFGSAAAAASSNSSSLDGYGLVLPIVRRQAIDTIAAMASAGVPLASYASRLLHPLARTLADCSGYTTHDVKRAAVDTLALLALQLREEYIVWVPTVRKACLQATLGAIASGTAGGDGGGIGLGGGGGGGSGLGGGGGLGGMGADGASIGLYGGEGGMGTFGRGSGGVAAFVAGGDRGGPGGGGGAAASNTASLGLGVGGVSGTGSGSAIRHETYERLVALLLGFGSGYGYTGDDSLALYGYGPPLPLPVNPADLAELLYDPGTCCADGSGIRIAAALALSISGSMLPSVTVPGPGGTVLDGAGGASTPYGLLTDTGTDNDTFAVGIGALGPSGLGLATAGADNRGKATVDQDSLRRTWDTSTRSTREDWGEWMRHLSVELLKESPSPALRACHMLANVHGPLAADLFNAAFVAVWAELYDEQQDSLIQAIESAFAADSVPTYILQTLLNLAEFMEHDEKALPIDVRLLGGLAERVRAFSKALHYKEMEFHSSPAACIEALISINNQLEQPEAAVGILKYAQHQMMGIPPFGVRFAHGTGPSAAFSALGGATSAAGGADGDGGGGGGGSAGAAATSFGLGPGMEVQEGWYEKLGRWEDALDGYARKQTDAPNSVSLLLGRMRCLKALGEWSQLDVLTRDAWPRLENNAAGRAMVAPLAARAAWALGDWSALEEYATYISEFTQQGAFMRAVLAVHRQAFDAAHHFIDRSRKLVANEFASAGGESYSHAYRRVVTVQQLSEMEEILTYLRLSSAGNAPGAHAYIDHVRHMWAARLRGCGRNVDVWNRILSVRSLATVAAENMKQWVQFASLCRRSGRPNMALKVLLGLGMDGGGGLEQQLRQYAGGHGSVMALTGLQAPASTAGAGSAASGPGTSGAGGGAAGLALAGVGSGTLGLHINVPRGLGPADSLAGVRARFGGYSGGSGSPSPGAIASATPGGTASHGLGGSDELLLAAVRLGAYSSAHPEVVYAFLKHLWHSGHREAAVLQLRLLTATLDEHAAARSSGVTGGSASGSGSGATSARGALQDAPAADASGSSSGRLAGGAAGVYGANTLKPEAEQALRVRCHLRLGQWQESLLEGAMASYAATGSSASFAALQAAGVPISASLLSPSATPRGAAGGPGASPHAAHGAAAAAAQQGGFEAEAADGSAPRLRRALTRGTSVASATSTGSAAAAAHTGAGAGGFAEAGAGPRASGGGGGGSAGGSHARVASDAYAQLITPIVSAFRTATHECGDAGYGHYRAWHAWAIMNFAAAEHHAENLRVERERSRGVSKPGGGAGGGGAAAAGGVGGSQHGQTPSGTTLPGSGVTGGPASGSLRSARRRQSDAAAAAAGGAGVTSPGMEGSASSGSASGGGGLLAGSSAAAAHAGPSPHAIAQVVTAHAVAAVKGFFRSIALGRTRLKAYVLQDLLRLLTLWFSHAEAAPVRAALEAGLASGAVSIEVWLQVIPQLIARIQIQAPATRKLLHQLLTVIGAAHPQALVYPLTVASKSASVPRRSAALSVLTGMRRRSARLVDQAEMVSRELIRVAILWHEMWHSGLEEASRQYFGDGNVQAMLATLLPLHEMMASPGPQTLREVAFVQSFGKELDNAYKWLLAYRASGRVGDLSQAWDLYYHVFRKINKVLPALTALELQYVSPTLLSAHDLELSVPGTYHAGAPVTRIMSFSPSIDVLPSKQRPRKITLLGSDGRRYTFLLKGHEDLRQDERVMQLFGLVNTLLSNDAETSRRDLSIRRYAVTPLSHNAGVVGWVPNCDTLHALIKEYRDSRKILLNIEHRLMVQMAPMFDHLTVLQRVEVFRYALDNTTGQDLYKVLWLKSASSEVWLERRTNYTRSLAVMSIVGYILGLGDRHPSNLMLDRVSGKVLHIDFGDCFEVAMTRDKFPERVPFRLTRMLVHAMEVSGIEGNYRSTCEAVMRVMRQHRDSVMAMLEAFVHDPLINWRLLNAGPAGGPAPGNADAAGAAAAAAAGAGGTAGAGGAGRTSPGGGLISGSRRGGSGGMMSSVSGAVRLAEGNPEARTLVQQGLAFAAEAEAATLAQAMAETGFDPEAGAEGAGVDAPTAAAMARSLATSIHAGGRGERERELMSMLGPEGTAAPMEALNERAVAVIRRIQAKLTGKDFAETDPIGRLMSAGIGLPHGSGAGDLASTAGPSPHLLDPSASLDVPAQVHRLICAATSHENLCQSYIGWCPFW